MIYASPCPMGSGRGAQFKHPSVAPSTANLYPGFTTHLRTGTFPHIIVCSAVCALHVNAGRQQRYNAFTSSSSSNICALCERFSYSAACLPTEDRKAFSVRRGEGADSGLTKSPAKVFRGQRYFPRGLI